MDYRNEFHTFSLQKAYYEAKKWWRIGQMSLVFQLAAFQEVPYKLNEEGMKTRLTD
jgi:hypothetical protein